MTFTEDNGRVYKSAEPMPWGMILVGHVFHRFESIQTPRRREFESYSFKPTINVIA